MKKQTATTNSDTRMLELRQELWDTARELRYAYARFNFITDPGLIDAGIYDINALKSRYDFLLRKMKALQGRPLEQRKSSPLPGADAAIFSGGVPAAVRRTAEAGAEGSVQLRPGLRRAVAAESDHLRHGVISGAELVQCHRHRHPGGSGLRPAAFGAVGAYIKNVYNSVILPSPKGGFFVENDAQHRPAPPHYL